MRFFTRNVKFILVIIVIIILLLILVSNLSDISLWNIKIKSKSSTELSNYFKINCQHEKLTQNSLSIEDILITVKTTVKHENTRLNDIIPTWYQFAKSQIYFVSDKKGDGKRHNLTESQMVYTNCGLKHDIDSLCCKFGYELSLFFNLNRTFKWFCHVDDDNYVHIPNLVSYLSKYDHNKNWYIGRTSFTGPTENQEMLEEFNKVQTFSFGTFGKKPETIFLEIEFLILLINKHKFRSGCLSVEFNHVFDKESASNKAYMEGCQKKTFPDDMYLGYLLETTHKIKLTNEPKFNHHLDPNQYASLDDIHSRVTFSFGSSDMRYDEMCKCLGPVVERPKIGTMFPNDTYRIKSLHCLLFPNVDFCKQMFIEAFQKLYTIQ